MEHSEKDSSATLNCSEISSGESWWRNCLIGSGMISTLGGGSILLEGVVLLLLLLLLSLYSCSCSCSSSMCMKANALLLTAYKVESLGGGGLLGICLRV